MKLIIESTTKVVELQSQHGGASVPARIWEGRTESGIRVYCYVTRVAVGDDQDQSQFEAELRACKAPSADITAIPLRLIL